MLACPVRAHAGEFDSALALVCTQAAVHCQQVAQIHELGVPADAANEAYRVADMLLQRTAASGLSCTDFRSKTRPPASKLEVRSPKLGRIFFSPVGAPAGLACAGRTKLQAECGVVDRCVAALEVLWVLV